MLADVCMKQLSQLKLYVNSSVAGVVNRSYSTKLYCKRSHSVVPCMLVIVFNSKTRKFANRIKSRTLLSGLTDVIEVTSRDEMPPTSESHQLQGRALGLITAHQLPERALPRPGEHSLPREQL